MRRLTVVILSLLAMGCEMRKDINEMSYAEMRQLADQIIKTCADQGITRSSPQYEPCVKQEMNRYITLTNQDRAKRIALGNAIGDGLQSMGASYSAAATSAPTTCRTFPAGGGYTTSCY